MKLILKTFASLLSALVVWEVILSNTVAKNPGFINHPVLGRINKAGIAVQGEEGFSRIKLNNLGMRAEDISPKQKNEHRALILGDSYTKAVQVSDNKTYSYLLQKEIKNKLKLNFNTINAGRDGASPAYYIHLANFYNSEIQPDSVVIQLVDQDFTEDILDKTKQFHVVKKANNFQTVYVDEFYSDNALSRLFLQKFPKLSFMVEYSVLRVGGNNLRKAMAAKPTHNNANKPLPEKKPSPDYDEVINWTLKTLKDTYPNLVILYLPSIDNYADITNQKPTEIEISLNKLAAKNNVNFINMREDFLKYYQTYYKPAHGFNNTILGGRGHINEIGHELSAKSLANIFEERILK